MSNAIFPVLAGLTFEVKATPTWSTVVQRSKNRARTALMNDPYPLWKYELTYEFLRGPGFAGPRPGITAANPEGYSELEQIVGFYNARGGGFDDFLLDPGLLTGRPADNRVAGSRIGTGDGTTATFYLVRNCGGFFDEVQDPVAPVYISVNGVAQLTGWTFGPLGAITFTTAPAAGAAITADFRWRMRVCFAADSLDLEGFMFALYELKTLKLEQVKQ